MGRILPVHLRTSPGPVSVSYALGALTVLGLALFLLDIPIQLSDSFGNLLGLPDPWLKMIIGEFNQPAYLRPLLFLEMKAVHDLSGGEYFIWFRGTHVIQVLILVGLYLHLIRPRTWRDAALVPLGLAVLVGHHTFAGTVNEAFPINTFMTVLIFCFMAAALSLGQHRRWHDVLALVLFWVAALTVESGLLVWVIFVGGALVGARGVSRGGITAMGLSLVGYFALRFLILEVGAPSLSERASGYGFSVLDPVDLVTRFGEHPLPFYLYNVATSVMSVLFGEPRAGVFRFTLGLTLGSPYPALAMAVVASTSATFLLGVFIWRRRGAWRRREFTHDDRLALLFLMLLGANAVISYPYTKDVIMSPAGAFFALAVFVSARAVVPFAGSTGPLRAGLLLSFCALLSISWSVRLLSVPVELWVAARNVRNQWAYADDWIELQRLDGNDPKLRALLETLRTDALRKRPPERELDWIKRSLFY